MDWISQGVTALISGMSAVFMILILISVMISSLKYLGHFGKKKEADGQELMENKASVQQMDQEEERHRIAAAITVALAQDLGLNLDQFIVRKFRRL